MTDLVTKLSKYGVPTELLLEVATIERLAGELLAHRKKDADRKKSAKSATFRGIPRKSTESVQKTNEINGGLFPWETGTEVAKTKSSYIRSSNTNHVEGSLRSPDPSRGSRLPQDWLPGTEGIEFAERLLGAERARSEVERFTDYWKGAAGQKARKVDWPATWRNWVRRAAETPRHGGEPRPGSFQESRERTINGLRKLRESINRNGHAHSDGDAGLLSISDH